MLLGWPTLSHCQASSLANPMLVTVIFILWVGRAPSGISTENLPFVNVTP